ncbi:tyrosine-type recombinase/integrase [Yersinia aldovae]|uniref:tyrosine-type recombinase/integrase n=1 Tax=Yersinia aldovae TaxID=29483 RepID=UPI0011A83857|nr:site-specific integrase [Yersinia aldovae]
MERNYGVSTFIMNSGERYCLVVDRSSGLPEYYPNLFLTTQSRNRGDAFTTMVSAAGNLVVLLRFLERRGIRLEERLLTKEFFKPHELDDLRDFAQRKQGKLPSAALSNSLSTLEDIEEATETVNNGTLYFRLTTFASYIRWFAMHILNTAESDVIEQINTMTEQIKERRSAKKGRNRDQHDRSLSDEQLDVLLAAIQPRADWNPFSLEVQRRNRLIILLLYHLGIRGGELLNIRIRDIDFTANRLKIARRSDEQDDPRTKEPNTKTRERIMPLADILAKELHDYITQDRRKVRYATNNDFLFVTHKDGPTVGQPISKAGYHKVISIVRAVSPQLYRVTGHMLRHTWNRRFSERMDAMDEPVSEERQEKIRSFLMGWKEGSGTAAIYNKRFIQQKGQKAALALQESSGTRLPENLKNDNK